MILVADMQSRAKYFDEEKMMAHGKSEDFMDGGYVLAIDTENVVDEVLPFKDELYGGRLRNIGLYLSTLKRQEDGRIRPSKISDISPIAIFYEMDFCKREQRRLMNCH